MDIRVKKSGRGEMWLMATYDDKVMGRLGEGIKAECCECTRKMVLVFLYTGRKQCAKPLTNVRVN